MSCGPGDRRMRGVYRYYHGTLTGEVVGGIFRGWWTQAPTHRRHDDAGRVELRLVETSDGPLIAGSWSYLLRGRSSPAGTSRRSAATRRRTWPGV